MAERMIPSDSRPYWRCRINGKEYKYPSGVMTDVPDAVAAIIDEINKLKAKQEKPNDMPVLPGMTKDDDGKVLKAQGGKYVLGDDKTGTVDAALSSTSKNPVQNKAIYAALQPLEVSATVGEDAYGRTAVTFDKTAGELYAAALLGRMMQVSILDVPVGEDETEDFIFLQPIDIIKVIATDRVDYIVKAHLDGGSSDDVFYGAGLSADDPVVVAMVQGE